MPRALTLELSRLTGEKEGGQKDRQKPLSGASEGNGFAFGSVKDLGSAGHSFIVNLHGVTTWPGSFPPAHCRGQREYLDS